MWVVGHMLLMIIREVVGHGCVILFGGSGGPRHKGKLSHRCFASKLK
uniref:Inactive rhomboid protein 1-like n=1 Tax=Rhizophora mucronata TaxID=61149 RepID=A0A2P2JZD5_RHIMU